MTNEEMIKWAKLKDASDFVWHARKENLDALIWRAKMEGRKEAFAQMSSYASMHEDAESLMSYPGGFLKRRVSLTDDDFLAAMGPCGK